MAATCSQVGRARCARPAPRRFVRVIDTRHPRQLSGPRLRVEPLGIPLLAQLERGVDEHLDELEAGGGVDRPRPLAIGPIRRDHRHEHDQPGVGHQPRHLADPADVLGAVGGREPEVGVEPVAHVVAVEDVGRAPRLQELLGDGVGDRRLARSGEPGEPHRHPAQAVGAPADVTTDGGVVPHDVIHGGSSPRQRSCSWVIRAGTLPRPDQPDHVWRRRQRSHLRRR